MKKSKQITLNDMESVRNEYKRMEKEILLQQYTFPDKPSTDGYYHINLPDKTKKSGYRQMKAKSLDALKEKVYKYENGVDGTALKTFKDVFEIVEKNKLTYVKGDSEKQSRERTVSRDRSEYKRFFEGTPFEKQYVEDISKKDIENVILMNLNKNDLRPKALSSMEAILRSVFKLAFQEYWIKDNVYERANLDQFKRMCIQPTSIKEREHSDTDIQRMLEYVHEKQNKNPGYFPAYALELQMSLGLRRGEVPPLTERDIVTENGVICLMIHKTMNASNMIVNHTKTGNDRCIPLSKDDMNIIERIRFQKKRLRISSDFLFPEDNENGCITYHQSTEFYRRMLKKLNIQTSRDCIKGTHAFRRTVETNLRNNGVSPQASANYMGHSTRVADQNYYTGGYGENDLQKIINI